MIFSEKQKRMLKEAGSRWNIYEGAVRSGKSYGSFFKVVTRLREVKNLPGEVAFIGRTTAAVERNVLTPMRRLGFPVSKVSGKGEFAIFGQPAYVFGAYNRRSSDALRGLKLKYAYGDEATTWDERVFDMLKSRLDCEYSRFDGTLNPEGPNHWLKKFIDGCDDLYDLSFTIDDNPFLSPAFVEALKKEYAGTVYYDRYILGRWVAAEGIIYRVFADRPDRFILKGIDPADIQTASVGVDFGGSRSATHFTCTGFTRGFERCIVLDEEHRSGQKDDPESLERAFTAFCARQMAAGYPLKFALADSAEQTLIRGLKKAAIRAGLPVRVENSLKLPIHERIALVTRLMGAGRFFVLARCVHVIDALESAVYDEKKAGDARLDDGTTDIDSLDATEYSIEPFLKYLIGG